MNAILVAAKHSNDTNKLSSEVNTCIPMNICKKLCLHRHSICCDATVPMYITISNVLYC